MAQRKTHMGERYIEADNGFGWTFRRGYVPMSVRSGVWETEIFGLTYRLVKILDAGWCLYLGRDVNPHFYGDLCADTLMPAIDIASEKIAKADLRGDGYERKP
jgi:hypothetical protein